MPPFATAGFRRFAATVKGFTVGQRTVAIIGLAVLALGSAALVSWLTKPNYVPLFTGLQSSDASAVVQQLGKDNVPYELADGGATVLVPQDKVYDERLKAASAGLPAAPATGYSLLDKMGVTSSEFQQNVTYKRAIEGELGTTISHLDGVRAATVQLAIPEKTVFTSQQQDPTASVFVQTQPGTTLASDKVDAIVHLTSAAVHGLKPANVSVVDSQGNVLSAVGTGTSRSGTKQAADYQQRTQAAVQAVLDRVLGPGNATVAVIPDINQESAQQKSETFSSSKDTAPLSQSSKTEKYTGSGGSGASGVLGPDNIAVPSGGGPTAAGGVGGTGGGTYDSTTDTRDNAINKVTEDRTVPAGALKRQSVSVAVNQAAANGLNLQNLNALVSAAAGIDTARGDVLSMQVVPFSTASADQAKAALAQAQADDAAKAQAAMWTNIMWAAIALLAILAGALLMWLRSRRGTVREPLDVGASIVFDEIEEPIAIEAPATAALPVAEHLPALPDPAAEVLDAERRRAQIDRLGATDPQKTAEYLRGLMDERQPV
ncbi:flagellar basal-body MS-ring/collar protein FliF [Sinomonas sp. ASV322]|uniref:flagellar basal-body MS-ring/collar protein FliF n=1 Tax=Sinomonas sp. ASV322 TaxID=3041920 RepID=UPI0027DE6694|nr:flagellar basal-body MS-ring/collar protein FliF [Sinomonas sp. ASV322]MDQ4504070.1 flagellar basal-body MS-ring/collar protein FliF [Sinomonas sp. ASV322]